VCFQPLLQLGEFGGKLPVPGERLTLAHECAHHEDAHLNGARGVEYAGGHNGSMLGEGIGKIAATAAAWL
jgi:hypothetical protein